MATAQLGGYAAFLEPARKRLRVLAMHMQGDCGMGIGGALEYGPNQARGEVAEELQRPQPGLAAETHLGDLLIALEQALVLAQCLLDLPVARQGGVIDDAQPLRGLELGLVVVKDAAFGDQPGGLVGQLLTAFAGSRLRVRERVGFGGRTRMWHGTSPGTGLHRL